MLYTRNINKIDAMCVYKYYTYVFGAMNYCLFSLVLLVTYLSVVVGQDGGTKHIKLNTTDLPPLVVHKPKHNKTKKTRTVTPVLISSINEVLDDLDQVYNITYLAELMNTTEDEHWRKVIDEVKDCDKEYCGMFKNVFRYFTEIKSLLTSNKDI